MKTMKSGYQVKVNITSGIEDYKNAFLIIYNNYKSDRGLLHFENDWDNGIYVTCLEEDLEAVTDWLEQFGEVTSQRVYIKTFVEHISDREWDKAYEMDVDIICVLEEE